MSRRLYPMNAMRAFEASARHLSFVKAADELYVTPAALSHQVKKLENYLGAKLFNRLHRGITLTSAGLSLLEDIRHIFADLDDIVERFFETEAEGALTISVAPMFAAKWLLPRLQDFETSFPELDLRISSSLSLVDFTSDAFDAAIRIGHGNYPGVQSIELLQETVTPMCSPRLLDDGRPATQASDLQNHVLLHDESMSFDPAAPTWETWFATFGAVPSNPARGPRFSQPDHALQAAVDGAGIVLGWRTLARDDIKAGRLVELFDHTLPLNSSLFLVYPEAYTRRQKIQLFENWLLQQFSVEASDPGSGLLR